MQTPITDSEIESYVRRQRSKGKQTKTIDAESDILKEYQGFVKDKDFVSVVDSIQSFIDSKLRVNSGTWGRSTANLALSTFRQYYAFRGVIVQPETYRAPQKRPEFLPIATLKKIAMVAEGTEQTIITILVATGCRIGEAILLKYENIHLPKGNSKFITITIPIEKQRVADDGDEDEADDIGKMPVHDVPILFPWAADILRAAKLANPTGKIYPKSVRELRRRIDALSKIAGIEKHIHPHMLRHSFASALRQEGYALDRIKELLGHKSIKNTEIYAHINPKKMLEEFEMIE